MSNTPSLTANLRSDLPAALVVFFVALPLCLGIALASGAPAFSGLIAGIIGGIVVGALSGSQIGVSGPAAGLAAIVLTAIGSLGFENFLVAVVLGGLIQVGFGLLRAGVIGYYFPSSVIKGMLTGIGLIIILKQIPHFLGYDADYEGDQSFWQVDGENTFTEIINALGNPSVGATTVGFIALGILLLWSNVLSNKGKIFTLIQGPLVAVAAGILYYVLTQGNPTWGVAPEHLVRVPVPKSFDDFLGQFTFPNFGAITNPTIWVTAFTIALVASLETLLCVEATDKLDPAQRVTPTNRELIAQGSGNILSGLIGGLPITQVIVRSSANIQSGGKTKMAAIIHGVFLLLSVIAVPTLLNKIPLAVLAAVLLIVGYKLANPATVSAIYRSGWKQFGPYIVTVLAIVFTDLLTGIALGLVVAIIIILYKSYQNSHFLHRVDSDDAAGRHHVQMQLAEEVTFFNKAAILRELDGLPEGAILELDVRKTRYLDYDIVEILENFATKARDRGIDIEIIAVGKRVMNPPSYMKFFDLAPAVEGH
ncbi:SulP family inorganic anion transporter [Neolewinella antarctica]|uniref:MFS superfamily sulfate permease-like transporter n=1 Tax=Neolewinella antarctica TaxID=442734 RepID=A0ABX0X9J1_9BACT|nr:SulP family inorganic anion transporter [Neolewinella antarctica]NJC25671.1 MFS superfamily sulfate permease-like transporter [Neolewinella antarctica]